MITWWQFKFQDAISPIIEEFLLFHDYAILILVFVLSLTGYLIFSACINKILNLSLADSQSLEGIWTTLPALILISLAVPSLRLLYVLDNREDIIITFKAIGHQWYWSYEYQNLSSQTDVIFDSFMTVEPQNMRLLEADNRAVSPWVASRVLIGSSDVLHAWAIPSLGVKADACPGRLNQVTLSANQPGVYYGQCSEICGANHSFMPVILESVRPKDFTHWLANIE